MAYRRRLARHGRTFFPTPGGAGAKHLVNAAVLNTLGPRGVVVNIARGSVVTPPPWLRALRRPHCRSRMCTRADLRPRRVVNLDSVVLPPCGGLVARSSAELSMNGKRPPPPGGAKRR